MRTQPPNTCDFASVHDPREKISAHFDFQFWQITRSDWGRVIATPSADILTIEQFAKTLSPAGTPCQRVVVCIVHEDDVNELDEPFYLARIVRKTRK